LFRTTAAAKNRAGRARAVGNEQQESSVGPFRDYRRVIQTAPRCCDTRLCEAMRNQPALLRQMFRTIVERSWEPAEIHMLRRAASAALL
jgi:hypothetical protein